MSFIYNCFSDFLVFYLYFLTVFDSVMLLPVFSRKNRFQKSTGLMGLNKGYILNETSAGILPYSRQRGCCVQRCRVQQFNSLPAAVGMQFETIIIIHRKQSVNVLDGKH